MISPSHHIKLADVSNADMIATSAPSVVCHGMAKVTKQETEHENKGMWGKAGVSVCVCVCVCVCVRQRERKEEDEEDIDAEEQEEEVYGRKRV